MSIDIDVVIETYSVLKEYISSKDRQAASDNLVSILVDRLNDKELMEFGSTDGYTKRSLSEYIDDDDADLEDDYGDL